MSSIAVSPRPKDRIPPDRQWWFRWTTGIGAAVLTALSCWALLRLVTGIAPDMPHLRTPALIIHLLTAIPAVPLGAYLLFRPKGDAMHRLLGKIWLTMMATTAIAAIFIRTINNGQFSWIHLFVILTIVSVPRAYLAARRGDIAKHRSVIAGLYLGAGVIAGLAAFMPHRTMWWMAFG